MIKKTCQFPFKHDKLCEKKDTINYSYNDKIGNRQM